MRTGPKEEEEEEAQARKSFDAFHEKVLEQMVPARRIAQLRVQRYERVQIPAESLAQYCQSIREAAQVLRIIETEQKVVHRIIEGYNIIEPALCKLGLPTEVTSFINNSYADLSTTKS
jgi:hypothetical protein